jgi:hypothetical protein
MQERGILGLQVIADRHLLVDPVHWLVPTGPDLNPKSVPPQGETGFYQDQAPGSYKGGYSRHEQFIVCVPGISERVFGPALADDRIDSSSGPSICLLRSDRLNEPP